MIICGILLGFVGYTAWYSCMILGATRICEDDLYNHSGQGGVVQRMRGFGGQLEMV